MAIIAQHVIIHIQKHECFCKRKYHERNIYKMKLTPQQQYEINQVKATMEIENMTLTEQTYKNLIEVTSGKKTANQMAEEIKRRYMHA